MNLQFVSHDSKILKSRVTISARNLLLLKLGPIVHVCVLPWQTETEA